MGIHEREYIRRGGAGGGGGGAMGRLMHPRGLSVITWLIIINVAVFVVDAFLPVQLFEVGEARVAAEDLTPTPPDKAEIQWPGPNRAFVDQSASTAEYVSLDLRRAFTPLEGIGHFSTTTALAGLQVWRFVTYQFLHGGLGHILFNMLGLFFFGPLLLRYLGSARHFLAFYFACGIAGAALYLLLNLVGASGIALPGALGNDPTTPLIGASASIYGVLIACAYFAGNSIIYVFGVIPMKLRVGAYLFVAIAFFVLLTEGRNAGGQAAHIGGAIAGWLLIRKPGLVTDFFDDFLDLFDRLRPGGGGGGGKRKLRGGRVREARPGRGRGARASVRKPGKDEARMDALLAKVAGEGIHSLTDEERAFLDKMSKDRRGGRGGGGG